MEVLPSGPTGVGLLPFRHTRAFQLPWHCSWLESQASVYWSEIVAVQPTPWFFWARVLIPWLWVALAPRLWVWVIWLVETEEAAIDNS